MDEIDVLQKALIEMKQAKKLKILNQELYDQLIGSIVYILKYSERNNISLPNEEGLTSLVFKAESLIDRIVNASDESLQRQDCDGDLTESLPIILK